MYSIIQKYTRTVLQNPDRDLSVILTAVFASLSPDQIKLAEPYFMPMYKLGEALRRAEPEVVDEIMKDVGLIVDTEEKQ